MVDWQCRCCLYLHLVHNLDYFLQFVIAMRTHTCGELTEKDKGKKAVLDGWVHARRDHGGVIFIDLRDRYGITQVVMGEKIKDAHKLRNEYVVEISGTVKERKKGTENKKIKTGKIEVKCEELKILAESEPLPIEIDDRITANDEVRLKYRYLDLRRPLMQKNLLFRHKFNMAVRNRSEEHTSELQSHVNLVCRLLLEKKK